MALPYHGPWTTRRVRQQFFDFFESRGHKFVPSSPVVPNDDPTRLFANAGMNQFRPIFLGAADPRSEMGTLKRAYNTQKCIRIGDLEDVGGDCHHHTFFEMLGNWSFGDYFKKEAIGFTWELVTEIYEVPKDRLYVTYFEGDPESGLAPDEETRQIWLDLGVAEDHILTGGIKDNFWDIDAKGGTGPCGPSTEVHFDRIGARNAAHLVNKDDPTVIEFWNNVFIQFNRQYDGTYQHLPDNHVDSAIGFERLTSVVQTGWSNYDLDVFTPILRKAQEITGARPYQGSLGVNDINGIDKAYRVIVDHIRTLAFSLSDGGLPGNTGRGYVIRRILCRCLWFAKKKLNAHTGSFLSSLLPSVVENMEDIFPEMSKKVEETKQILNQEEEIFSRTFDAGEQRFEQLVAEAKQAGVKELRDKDAWHLYDAYGFHIDLTRLMAEEQGLVVNTQAFEKAQAAEFALGW